MVQVGNDRLNAAEFFRERLEGGSMIEIDPFIIERIDWQVF